MHLRHLAAAAFALALGAAQPALAAPFACPAQPLEGALPAAAKALLPPGDALDRPDALNAAVDKLRAQSVRPVLIIDGLIAAYCPVVAAQAGLSDAQKTARVTRFAARITRTVYAIDGADEIILDVGLPPAVVDAINAKARAAGITAEDWVRNAVNAALK